MSTNGTTITTKQTATATDASPISAFGPEQLTLLAPTSVPLQFRLDERTRRSGLAHVAALRSQIAAQAAARHLSAGGQPVSQRSPNRQIAA
jgi:hypothetical protein